MRGTGWFQASLESDRHLSAQIRELLLMGSTGKSHLFSIGLSALNVAHQYPPRSQPHVLRFGLDMLRSAWEIDPLDGTCAKSLLDVADKLKPLGFGLDPALHAAAKSVTSTWNPPAETQQGDGPLVGMDADQCRHWLEARLQSEPSNLHYWHLAREAAWDHSLWAWLADMLQASWPFGKDALFERILVDCAYGRGDYEQARHLCLSVHSRLPMALLLVFAGEAAWRTGDAAGAMDLQRKALESRPWDTNLILALHDRLQGLHKRRGSLSGQVRILLYSYNKARDLGRTLESLFAGNIGAAQAIVLDNGSTDGTGAMLQAWQERVGETRLRIISLPINIGAPAARNWLKRLPDVQAADWAAYLDDDVILPEDWLAGLAAAVELHPAAGVWGCKTVDDEEPLRVQIPDTHLIYVPSNPQSPFSVSALQTGALDHGQFDYIRPCAHVTGCCHLFSGSTLRDSTDFDLRFSPSQCDDIDHDLQLLLAGKQVVYTGHVAVRHVKNSGRLVKLSAEQMARVNANFYKLQSKYDASRVQTLKQFHLGGLESDFVLKRRALRDMLG